MSGIVLFYKISSQKMKMGYFNNNGLIKKKITINLKLPFLTSYFMLSLPRPASQLIMTVLYGVIQIFILQGSQPIEIMFW